MCKPEIKGQARLFNPETTPERAYQEDALEQLTQIRQLIAELLSETKQCKGILAGKVSPKKIKVKKDPADNPFVINRYATKDRIIVFGKAGKVDYVVCILTARTVARLGIEPGQKARIGDDFSICLNAEYGRRSAWRKRKDGGLVIYFRRELGIVTGYRYGFYEVAEEAATLLARGDLIEAVPYPEEGETEESEEADA